MNLVPIYNCLLPDSTTKSTLNWKKMYMYIKDEMNEIPWIVFKYSKLQKEKFVFHLQNIKIGQDAKKTLNLYWHLFDNAKCKSDDTFLLVSRQCIQPPSPLRYQHI